MYSGQCVTMAGADRVTICHLGATKTALTISLDPPWTLTHVHLDALPLLQPFLVLYSFLFSVFSSDQHVINFDWLLYMNDVCLGYQFYF